MFVGQRLCVGEFDGQLVARLEGRREGVEADDVFFDLSRFDRHRAGVRVIRTAVGGAFFIKFTVAGLEVAGGD